MEKYKLTKEHEARIPEWNAETIRQILSLEPVDFQKMVDAIRRCAAFAGLPKPEVLLGPSPLALWWWYERFGGQRGVGWWAATGDATWAATRDATWAATWAATEAATRDVTRDVTRTATVDATWAAIEAATGDATWAATRAATWAATGAAIEAATGDAIEAATGDAIEAATWNATEASTGAATWAATEAATRDATRAATWAATGDAIGAATGAATVDVQKYPLLKAWPAYDSWNGGREWLSWIRFLLFFRDVCGVSHDKWEHGQAYYNLQRYSGSCTIHFKHIVLVSQPPIRRSLIQLPNGWYQLHQDGQAAVEYADGFRYYRLHGVPVPRWMVETPAERLDIKRGLALENAEQRREFVRKVGVERIYQVTGGKVLNKQGGYELVALNFNDKRNRPYLKMKNPSIGVWHLEGVPPHITTVQRAINWRAGNEQTDWTPEVLT